MIKILVADDEHGICEAFRRVLESEGHTPLVASTGREAVEIFRRERPAAVFMDVQMPDASGLDALQEIRRIDPQVPVVVMTAHGSVQTAMRALTLGAFDYLGKPLELADIRALLERALHPRQAETPTMRVPAPPVPAEADGTTLVGTSRPMQEIFKMIGLLADNDLTVLITGESGVGKELVARSIHAHGPRRERPFVAIDCTALPDALESELFGHEKGAFTGAHGRREGQLEAAADGTVFLDAVSELPGHLQAKLLRVLQERSFRRLGGGEPIPLRARIVAASKPVADGAADGVTGLRDDFYYRVSLVRVHVPPLRERLQDIPDLAAHFLARANRRLGRELEGIEPAAMEALLEHPWPGNVRELENTVQRAALTARGRILSRHDLHLDSSGPAPRPVMGARQRLQAAARAALAELVEGVDPGGDVYRQVVGAVEQALADEALRRCDGNQVAASALLGINRTTLRNKLTG